MAWLAAMRLSEHARREWPSCVLVSSIAATERWSKEELVKEQVTSTEDTDGLHYPQKTGTDPNLLFADTIAGGVSVNQGPSCRVKFQTTVYYLLQFCHTYEVANAVEEIEIEEQ